jgi:N-acetylglucosaminyl-diphospho-decaprenol L-rhamnosyltransferase
MSNKNGLVKANGANSIKLSIITVSYKSNEFLKRCIKSIEKFNDVGDAIEYIIVDNYPFGDDAFSNIAADFPNVIYINNPSNGGFGQGNNIGVEKSSGQYILFLNPDTELIEPIFKFAIYQFDLYPKIAAFGMTLCDEYHDTTQNSFGVLPEENGYSTLFFTKFLIKYINITPSGVYPWGANIFIRRNIFIDIGGFDETYFLCYEEPDLIHRIPSGYKVKIYKKKIFHRSGHSLERENFKKILNTYLQSEQYYFKKYNLDYLTYSKIKRNLLYFKKIINSVFLKRLCDQDKLMLDYYNSIILKKNIKTSD